MKLKLWWKHGSTAKGNGKEQLNSYGEWMAKIEWKIESVEEVKEPRGQGIGRIIYDAEITKSQQLIGEYDIEPERRG